ncbi:MAG: DUF2177 family protein [Planctomycetes bacterium]|nr:DUF2177 family protein [Planctomycetota bacterium]
MARIALAYLGGLVSLLALDYLWLAVVARGFYVRHLGARMREQPKWLSAAACYVIFVAGVMWFAAWPGVERASVGCAALNGAAFGLVAFATFDLTAHALLKDFPFAIVVPDLLWGTTVATVVASTCCWIALRWAA